MTIFRTDSVEFTPQILCTKSQGHWLSSSGQETVSCDFTIYGDAAIFFMRPKPFAYIFNTYNHSLILRSYLMKFEFNIPNGF